MQIVLRGAGGWVRDEGAGEGVRPEAAPEAAGAA